MMFPQIKHQLEMNVENQHREKEKIQEKDDQTTLPNATIQTFQNEVQVLQQNNEQHHQDLTTLNEEHQKEIYDLVQNRHVPRTGEFDTALEFVEKNEQQQSRTSRFQYYVIRCQKCNLQKRVAILRIRFPNLKILEPVCDNVNATHCWNRYSGNHFNIPDDLIEFFEDLFVEL